MVEAVAEAARPSACASLLKLLRGAAPIVIQQACLLLVSVLTVARVGHAIGTHALASLSLGNLTYNLLGLTLLMAPMLALETYASQAWGAKRYADVGLNVQRAILVALLLLVPAAVAWLYAEPILRQLGQPEEVARLAARFLRGMLPVLPIQLVFEATKRFLYAQAIMWPPAFAALLAVGGHIAWLDPLVSMLGFDGAALGLLCAHSTMLLALVLQLAILRPHDPRTWPGLRPVTLAREVGAMKAFVGTAIAGLVSLSEWIFWEAICFRCGVFGATSLAIHGVAYSVVPLTFMVPLGLAMAIANGVGNAIGAGEHQHARRLASLGVLAGLVLSLCYASLVYLLGERIARSFSSDDIVIAGALQIWPIVSALLVFDALFAVGGGILRGLGLNRRAAFSVVASLWCIGLPLMLLTARDVYHLWLVMLPTYALLDAIIIASAVTCVSWRRLAQDVRERHSLAGADAAAVTAAPASEVSVELPQVK